MENFWNWSLGERWKTYEEWHQTQINNKNYQMFSFSMCGFEKLPSKKKKPFNRIEWFLNFSWTTIKIWLWFWSVLYQLKVGLNTRTIQQIKEIMWTQTVMLHRRNATKSYWFDWSGRFSCCFILQLFPYSRSNKFLKSCVKVFNVVHSTAQLLRALILCS